MMLVMMGAAAAAAANITGLAAILAASLAASLTACGKRHRGLFCRELLRAIVYDTIGLT